LSASNWSARRRAAVAAVVAAALWSANAVAERQGSAKASAERPAADRPFRALDAATDAWDRGDYIPALNGYIQILSAPGGDAALETIALATGELFQTRELTADGRAPRFTADGAFIVYETGLEVSRRTKILRNDASRAQVADLPGVSATFSHPLNQVAYLRIPDNDEIRRASAAIDAASLTAQNRTQLTQTLAWLIAKHAAIVVRDLQSGREMELPAPDLLKTGLAFGGDGRQLFFLGARESDPDRTDVYAISEMAPKAVAVVDAPGLKSAPIVDPSGKALLYVVPAVNPLRRPPERPGRAAEAGRAGEAERGGQPGRAGQATEAERGDRPAGQAVRREERAPSFVVVDLASHGATTIAGSAPALSGDGKTLAYVARNGGDYALMLGPTTGIHTTMKTTRRRLDAPALSADGGRVAFQQMVQDDWEIFVADRSGANEIRVTRDIQHDLLPRFLGGDRLLAVMGEPRHRRSYVYDLELRDPSLTPRRTRLFHNNSVRTISPEYQWSPSADGTQILIGAERDGDTVSPARGVYLVSLTRKVTKAAVLDRLRASLKSETALKAAVTHTFDPMTTEIRQVLARVSTTRIFDYEKALADFDSRHITQPGNRKASAFLFDTFASFGYQPEYQWFDPAADRAAAARDASSADVRVAPNVSAGNAPTADGRTANLVATLRGTVNPELVYVISSHYDSVVAGPGADDDASGVAALLEAARVLKEHPLPATVVFACFTGEESGLLGSREFVRRAKASGMRVAGALNNDMVGWTNDGRLDNTIRYSNAGIRDIQHGAAMLFTKLITYDARYFKGTDAVSFYDAFGDLVGGIGSYPVLASPHYHQATDVLERENHQLIAETAKTTIATVMLMASSPSRLTQLKVDSINAASAALSWAPSAERGVTSYIVAFGPPADPLRSRVAATEPHAAIAGAAPGTVVSVKAVNARRLEGWDWSRITIEAPRAPHRPTP
jgi:hypothetical protein